MTATFPCHFTPIPPLAEWQLRVIDDWIFGIQDNRGRPIQTEQNVHTGQRVLHFVLFRPIKCLCQQNEQREIVQSDSPRCHDADQLLSQRGEWPAIFFWQSFVIQVGERRVTFFFNDSTDHTMSKQILVPGTKLERNAPPPRWRSQRSSSFESDLLVKHRETHCQDLRTDELLFHNQQQVNHRWLLLTKFLQIVTLHGSKNPDRLHGPTRCQHFCIFATSALLQWKIFHSKMRENQLIYVNRFSFEYQDANEMSAILLLWGERRFRAAHWIQETANQRVNDHWICKAISSTSFLRPFTFFHSQGQATTLGFLRPVESVKFGWKCFPHGVTSNDLSSALLVLASTLMSDASSRVESKEWRHAIA